MISLAVPVQRAPSVVRAGYDRLTAPSESWTARELKPAAANGVSTEALPLAEHELPRTARYTIVTGNAPALDPDTAVAVRQVLAYWLLPRLYVPDLHAVRWVITYHEPSESLGVKVVREIGLGPDANLVEVAP